MIIIKIMNYIKKRKFSYLNFMFLLNVVIILILYDNPQDLQNKQVRALKLTIK